MTPLHIDSIAPLSQYDPVPVAQRKAQQEPIRPKVLIPNPFRKYYQKHRASALRDNIIRDVAAESGKSKAAVSRAFGGHSQRTSDGIVNALNEWLMQKGYPTSEDAKTARNAVNELRAKKHGSQ